MTPGGLAGSPFTTRRGTIQDEVEAVMAKGRVEGAGDLPAPLTPERSPTSGLPALRRDECLPPGPRPKQGFVLAALGPPKEVEQPQWRLRFVLARWLSYSTRTHGWRLKPTKKVKPKDKASLERSPGQPFPSSLTPMQRQWLRMGSFPPRPTPGVRGQGGLCRRHPGGHTGMRADHPSFHSINSD